MNERIKELAKAHLVREEHTDFGWQECHKYEFDEDELTEFAELIVKECVNTLEFHGFEDAIPYVKWMATNKLGQHFGVEE